MPGNLMTDHSSSRRQDVVDTEIVFGRRQDSLRVFVSSKMHDGSLNEERRAAADTINDSPLHHAWCWEDDAPVGAHHSEEECTQHARTSDGLVLLLADELTQVTRAEYVAARENGASRYVFVRQGAPLTDEAEQFVEAERKRMTVTGSFANTSELKTRLTKALFESAVRSERESVTRRRTAEMGSTVPIGE